MRPGWREAARGTTTIAEVSGTQRAVTVRVPAKINLLLGVGPRRPDGFHELNTVFCAVELYDTVTAVAAGELRVQLTGPESAGLPRDQRNLAWRAATLLASHAGIRPSVALLIDKAIPVAAGLAGGSADAAATLLACARLWNLALDPGALGVLAAELGSDVSFALHGRCALGTGRGERLRPVASPEFHWVLAAARGELSTPEVYGALDRQRSAGIEQAPVGDPEPVIAALATGNPHVLAASLGNDLEPAALALAPYLGDTLAAGREAGALAGLVSGSGPTCAFLAADRETAELIARRLLDSGTCRFARAVVGGTARPELSVRAAIPPSAAPLIPAADHPAEPLQADGKSSWQI